MNQDILHKKGYRIKLGDVDVTGQLKPGALFSLFQDVASEAADRIGYGYEYLRKTYDAAWILVRLHFEAIRFPKYNEQVLLETWPLLPDRFEYPRDFLLKNEKGEVLIRARSFWAILHIQTRKMMRADRLNLPNLSEPPGQPEAVDRPRLTDFGHLQPVWKIRVGISETDINGHLNNAKYVDYMMDCFSMEEYRNWKVRTLDIQFVHETFSGETVELYRDLSRIGEGVLYIEGKKSPEGQRVFKGLVRVEKRLTPQPHPFTGK